MKTPQELIKELGSFYEADKNELEFVAEEALVLSKTKLITEDTIKDLAKCEEILHQIKMKYFFRLIRLLKSGVAITE